MARPFKWWRTFGYVAFEIAGLPVAVVNVLIVLGLPKLALCVAVVLLLAGMDEARFRLRPRRPQGLVRKRGGTRGSARGPVRTGASR